MHLLDHKGEFFSVRGPLNVARSPQDAPVLVMSGLAEVDLDFGAKVADTILLDQLSAQDAKAVYDDLKCRVQTYGRDPEAVKVLVAVPAGLIAAESLDDWFGTESCDGFNFALSADRSALDDFTERVLPELRRRGPARSAHAGVTLRAHLGLGAGAEK